MEGCLWAPARKWGRQVGMRKEKSHQAPPWGARRACGAQGSLDYHVHEWSKWWQSSWGQPGLRLGWLPARRESQRPWLGPVICAILHLEAQTSPREWTRHTSPVGTSSVLEPVHGTFFAESVFSLLCHQAFATEVLLLRDRSDCSTGDSRRPPLPLNVVPEASLWVPCSHAFPEHPVLASRSYWQLCLLVESFSESQGLYGLEVTPTPFWTLSIQVPGLLEGLCVELMLPNER